MKESLADTFCSISGVRGGGVGFAAVQKNRLFVPILVPFEWPSLPAGSLGGPLPFVLKTPSS